MLGGGGRSEDIGGGGRDRPTEPSFGLLAILTSTPDATASATSSSTKPAQMSPEEPLDGVSTRFGSSSADTE